MSGKITVVCGPMFAGKTTELIRYVLRCAHAERNGLVVRSTKDTRAPPAQLFTNAAGITELGVIDKQTQSYIRVVTVDRLDQVRADATVSDIFVDEGQFFDDLLAQCREWANGGIRVVVAGLLTNAAQKPFGQMCDLLGEAEEIAKLTAICNRCKADTATFTVRRTGADTVRRTGADTGSVTDPGGADIGGAEKFVAVCRKCRALS